MIKTEGEITEMGSTGFVRDSHVGKGRFDLLPMYALWEVAKHQENGALKYHEDNIRLGAPQHSLIDSAFRHLIKYVNGWDDEPHLVACAWNILWALEQETTHPELQDLFYRRDKKDEAIKALTKIALKYDEQSKESKAIGTAIESLRSDKE